MTYNEPLNLPQGSVRAILTLAVLAAALILHAIGQASLEFDGIAAAALGNYFGYRTASTATPTLPPPPPIEDTMPLVLPASADEPGTVGFVPGE